MYSVPGALRDLRQDREDGDRTASGGSPASQGKEHGHLWGKASQGTSPSTGDGIMMIKL